MKVLVKTKSENVVLVLPGTRDCIDYFRHRVYDNIPDMDRWESRGLIERTPLKEDASDDVFLSLFKKDSTKAVSNFLKRYSNSVKVEDEGETKEEKVEKQEEVVLEEVEKPQVKVNTKSYKRR
jgi:hypothetical protein